MYSLLLLHPITFDIYDNTKHIFNTKADDNRIPSDYTLTLSVIAGSWPSSVELGSFGVVIIQKKKNKKSCAFLISSWKSITFTINKRSQPLSNKSFFFFLWTFVYYVTHRHRLYWEINIKWTVSKAVVYFALTNLSDNILN